MENQPHVTMHKKLACLLLSYPSRVTLFSLAGQKKLNTFSSFSLVKLLGKETDRHSASVSHQVEKKFITPAPTQSSIRQGTAQRSYFSKVPPPVKGFLGAHFHIWSIYVNQSTYWVPLVYHIPQFINTGEHEMTFEQIWARQAGSMSWSQFLKSHYVILLKEQEK